MAQECHTGTVSRAGCSTQLSVWGLSLSRPTAVTRHQHHTSGGLQSVGPLLAESHPELVISKRRMRNVESIECVRLNREVASRNLGYSSRPFVLCGLPVKRPASGCLLHERRNGQFVLQVTGHPSYGLPWGQDRLVPIIPGNTRDPTAADSADHIRKRCSDAGRLRDATRRYSVSPSGRSLPANLRGHHLLRY